MKLIYPLNMLTGGVGVSQLFGEHGVDYSQYDIIGHNGLDIAAPLGTPIMAVHDGWIVEQTAKETGFGLRITQRIEADGKFYQVVYGHMQRLQIPITTPYSWKDKSLPVKQGQVIGYVNSSGYSTGNHCHLGLYELTEAGVTLNKDNGYGGAIDPLLFIKRKTMNDYVKTINIDGVIYFGVPLDSEDTEEVNFIKNMFNKELTINPDGTVITDITAKKV